MFTRPPLSPKIKLIQNLSFQDYHTFPKLKNWEKSVLLGPPHPPKEKILQNQSLQDQYIDSKSSVNLDLNNECTNSSPLWPTKSLFKTIFWGEISYWLHEPCHLGDLNNEHAKQSFPQSYWRIHFQDHLLSRTIIMTWWALSPRRPNNECAESSQVSLINSLFKTIFQVEHHKLKAMSPGRPEQWMCRGFPTVIDERPFQDHLLSKTISSTWVSVSKETWTNVQGASPLSLMNDLSK